MKKKLMFVALLMGLIMSFSTGLIACSDGGNTSDPSDKPGPVLPDDGDDGDEDDDQKENTVSKIAVKTAPDKTEYWVGDTFSVEGGVITVTYRDKTTKDIPMTDKDVKVGSVNMNIAALSKTVRVTYENKSANFTIKIKEKGGLLTFDYNYTNAPAAEQIQTEKDVVFGRDEAPAAEREDFTFDKWYTDESCTVEYLFNSPVASATTLYAGWKEDGATYYKATYDLNYYGAAVSGYTQLVKSGDPVRELAFTPERAEFRFDGWFSDEECSVPFTVAGSQVTEDTTVYAKWVKTKTGSSSYTFEAENVSMDGQEGPGASGSAGGSAMIVPAANEGVSGMVISYLYKKGLHVDFYLASSEDATATLTVYVCAEFEIALNSDMYKMTLTNSAGEAQELEYAAVNLTKGGPVVAITINNVQLKEGSNLISLITNNTDNPTGVAGSGTYEGTAPMIDRISVETEAVVTWDGAKGLPKDNG